jgi:hypothetical protein
MSDLPPKADLLKVVFLPKHMTELPAAPEINHVRELLAEEIDRFETERGDIGALASALLLAGIEIYSKLFRLRRTQSGVILAQADG